MDVSSVRYGGIQVSTATAMGKELLKFERSANYRPENNPYPTMLYHAKRAPNGQVKVIEDTPVPHGFTPDALVREQARVEAFNRECQKTVKDEASHKEALNAGWRDTPTEALAQFEAEERKLGNAAAERHHSDAKMSEAAQAEAAEVDASTEFHVADISIPKRRGRKPKSIS